MKRMADMPERERPREKLAARGVKALSDLELLAVILGRGSRGAPVMTLAQRALKVFDEGDRPLDLDALRRIPGMGPAKGAQLAAAMEFARRRIRPAGMKIRETADILPLVRHYADRKQEHFLCAALNGANELIALRLVTVGLVDESQAHPREVFADPITDRASSVIVAHNHPSGAPRPSEADRRVTRRLREAGAILGIHLLDHIIFTHDAHFSFAEARLLDEGPARRASDGD